MSLSPTIVQSVVDEFLNSYNGNIHLQPLVRDRQEEIYGQKNSADKVGAIQGSYHPARFVFTVFAAAMRDEADIRKTLRHELLGHYGLNTFKPIQKHDLLLEILATRQEHTLASAWKHIDTHYAGASNLLKAEELFCFIAEGETDFFQRGWDRVVSLFQDTLRSAGLSDRPLTIHELRDEARQIAKGIREGQRFQQNFPASDQELFSRRKNTFNHPEQASLFDDWMVSDVPAPIQTVSEQEAEPEQAPEARFQLAVALAKKLNETKTLTSKELLEAADEAFGGTQAEGIYTTRDAYDAMETAFNLHLMQTEKPSWMQLDAQGAQQKAIELTERIQRLPTQTKRDAESDEYQQFSTPPALSFVANWVARIAPTDIDVEPSAGTGDLAVWGQIAGAEVVLNELSPRRRVLLESLFPNAQVFGENAEQLHNVLPSRIRPTVIVMNPPFSSTAGRVQGERNTKNGAKHLEQALHRLEEGGRLVAIVGNGMAADRPAFGAWWQEIKSQYTVLANVGINGREYVKYGTSFNNNIIVIDKTGPTTKPVLTGFVESVSELPTLLEGVRNERLSIEPAQPEYPSPQPSQPVPDTVRSNTRIGSLGAGARSPVAQPPGDTDDAGAGIADRQTSIQSDPGNVTDDGVGAGNGVPSEPIANTGGGSGGDFGGNRGLDPSPVGSARVEIESADTAQAEFTDSVFSNYSPQRLSIAGAKPHPGKLVQSAAMAAVLPPRPTYRPSLGAELVQDGLLSIAQLESLVYAGQAHAEILPNGSRRGFFIGDGTGVGKGREISGIILDNEMQGRQKALWVSFNEGLMNDAKRDFAGVGGNPDRIFSQGKFKAGDAINVPSGVMFTTYSTLRSGEKKQITEAGSQGGKTRAQQIVEWLGKDFDGVIAFDEAHSMGNAIAIKGKRGDRKPSQQAIAGINLQRELPKARVVYVSATGATEVSNLSYADRLGLWGEGTPFADVSTFIGKVSQGGIAAMELISRDMKAMGMYIARSLSYDGVTYERLEHELTGFQEDIYNELAGAWQLVLNNVDAALERTQADKSAAGKSAAMSQFWGAHQRFFNQVITAMQTPAVIDDIHKQLAAGNAAVIQLVNTNEAAQERIVADAVQNDAPLEELDFTPRQMLMDYVRNGFPVAVYEAQEDADGRISYVPAKDSTGNLIFDRQAIGMRDKLLADLEHIRVPENPLDSILNAFGVNRVAEITGRGRRFIQTRDDDGQLKVTEEKRGKNSARVDAEAFQGNKKDILIFSGAGGTGYSFHADKSSENQRRRIHYILQPGWRADGAVQGFGRTHRTNEANEPHYVLPTTNLKAQKRFVSSIARRLDQLGALTRGQREATSQGMFSAADNLESEYAKIGLQNFFKDMHRGSTPLDFQSITKAMGLNLMDESGGFSEGKIPGIPQFLNRLLSLKTFQQNAVFAEFESRLVEAVGYAKQRGTYDEGLQTLKAKSIVKTLDKVVYNDLKSGSQTRFVELTVTTEIGYRTWGDVAEYAQRHTNEGSGFYVSEHGKSKGSVFFMVNAGERIDHTGKPVHRGVVVGIKRDANKYIDNADSMIQGRGVVTIGAGYSRKTAVVTLTSRVALDEAEQLWSAQVAMAPPTEVRTERMLVGVILPIWDRVEGEEKITRLQTDDGEQLLGRRLGSEASTKTLKNLGVGSAVSEMKSSEILAAILNGERAQLGNRWEIALSRVAGDMRIEVKPVSSFTRAELGVLADQGTFMERIDWRERVFIPQGADALAVLERITASKPVVNLVSKAHVPEVTQDADEEDDVLGLGVPNAPQSDLGQATKNEAPTAVVETAASAPWEAKHANRESTPQEAKTFIPEATIISANENMEVSNPKKNAPTKDVAVGTGKKPFHEAVAEKLIQQLKAGTAPWQKPWKPGEPGAFLPINPTTGKRYKGINAIHLLSQGHTDHRWLTYKQALGIDAQVRKGEKGTPIQYWKFSEEQSKLDSSGRPVLDANGKPVTQTVALERPRVFFATVFNAEQIDGLPAPLPRVPPAWSALERAENILQASGAVIRHGEQNRAYYLPSTDSIHLPDKGQFPTADNYYATVLHELGHWTGHESRLNRDLSHPFGSEGYAREELRAEIASMILGDELGIAHDPGQHAAYVASWIKSIEEDPLEIFRAAADAEKIHDYVISLEQKQLQEQSVDSQSLNQETDMNQVPIQNTAGRLVDQLLDGGVMTREEALLTSALRDFRTGSDATREVDMRILNEAAQNAFGVDLPGDFTGQVEIVGVVVSDGPARRADEAGEQADAFQVYARRGDAQPSDDAFVLVATYTTEGAARKQADRLALIDAHAQVNEHEKAAKLARIHEEHVRRDPNSTAEDIAAAKEARKDADFNAMKNDEDMQRRIAEYERAGQANGPDVVRGEPPIPGVKTYLDVPFEQKDEAKALGAKWDRQERSWYVLSSIETSPFAQWVKLPDASAEGIQKSGQGAHLPSETQERHYLAVPYGEHVAAKAAGAQWDKAAKSWFATSAADLKKLERWVPEKAADQQGPAMLPEEEFAEALGSLGCIVDGQHPIMDGERHRITVEGDKQGEHAGFYVGHLDGHPAGYIKNNRTGIEMKWKSKGYTLDENQKAQLQADAAAKWQIRDAEHVRVQEQTAQRLSRQMADLVPATQPTAYMQAKGIQPQVGVLTDAEGQKTYVPATDASGKHWTMQYILEDGTKRFAKDSRKEGCFHAVGGLDALAKAPALVIGEGYATAGSLSQTLGFATVAAFDAGNLIHVAKALQAKFPDKPIIIAGDDDKHLEATQGVNPGRSKAVAAAKAVDGKVLFPIFAPGEQANDPKGFTDFNDLANKSLLGNEGLDRQVNSVVNAVIEQHHAKLLQQQELARNRQQQDLPRAQQGFRKR